MTMGSFGSMPISSSHELAVGEFTATELADLSKALARSTAKPSAIPTPALTYVRQLFDKGRSAIVIMPEGGGKTAIVQAIANEEFIWDKEEVDDIEWIPVSDCSDVDSLIRELWEYAGFPAPTFSEVWDKGADGLYSKHKDGLTCFYCKRECSLVSLKLQIYIGFPDYTDQDIVAGLEKQGGDCPLIRNRTMAKLPTLRMNIALEVPGNPSLEYLKIIRKLYHNRDKPQFIILCPPEAEDSLHKAFPALVVRKPPATPVLQLLQIYAQRLENAGLTVTPLPPSSLTLLAIISRGNPGRFFQLIDQLIDDIDMDGKLETVSDAYVYSRIRDEISDDLAIQIIIGQLRRSGGSWVKAKTFRQMFVQIFNHDVSLESVGCLMVELGLRKRRNPDAEYFIGDFEVHNEILSCLTEGTERTKGGD